MATLAAVAYPQQETAAQAAAALVNMQKEYLIQLDDVAWVTKDAKGKAKLHQGSGLTGAGAAGGAFWGFLFGLIFLVPVAGLLVGAAAGALAGHFTDIGIDDKWIKDVSSSVPAGGSALFILARNANQERVLPEMAKFGGKIITTNLPDDQQKALEDSLAGSQATSASQATASGAEA